MRHFDMLHIYKENKAMPNQMVQAVATRRYRLSTTGESRSAVILLTSLDILVDIVLLENMLLNIVSVVQTKIFQQRRISMKLSRCSVGGGGAGWVPAREAGFDVPTHGTPL